MAKFAVLGCGAWGATFAKILADNGHDVIIWTHRATKAQHFNRSHRLPALGDIDLPKSIVATDRLAVALSGADYVVVAVASAYLSILEDVRDCLGDATPAFVFLCKGFVDHPQALFVSDYFNLVFKGRCVFSVLSGPNLAGEIVKELPALSVLSSPDTALSQRLQAEISHDYFRVYSSTDYRGVELSGTLKNCFAIAAGLISGLELGNNALSAMVSRALIEMMGFVEHFGGQRDTVMGLSGLGDLMTTCTSPLSRNFQVGFRFAKNRDLEAVLASMGTVVVEGLRTTEIVCRLIASLDLEMPIVEAVYRVFYEGAVVEDEIRSLMSRSLKSEG